MQLENSCMKSAKEAGAVIRTGSGSAFRIPGEAVQSGGVRRPEARSASAARSSPDGPAGKFPGREQVLPVCKNQLIAVVRSSGLLKEGVVSPVTVLP